jgi:hypothetical protein
MGEELSSGSCAFDYKKKGKGYIFAEATENSWGRSFDCEERYTEQSKKCVLFQKLLGTS